MNQCNVSRYDYSSICSQLNDYAKPGILKLLSCEQSHASHQDENLVRQTLNLPFVEENSAYIQEKSGIGDQLQHFNSQLEHDKRQYQSISCFNQQHQGETSSYGHVGQNQARISESPFYLKQIAHLGSSSLLISAYQILKEKTLVGCRGQLPVLYL